MQFSNIQSSSLYPVFSPCSNYFATLANNNLYIKDAGCSDLKNYGQIMSKDKEKTSANKITGPFKFSHDSKLIAVRVDKRIQIYGIEGKLHFRIRDQNYEAEDFAWMPRLVGEPATYQLIVFYSGQMNLFIYNLSTGKEEYIRNFKFKTPNGLSFSKNSSHPGTFMAVLQRHSNKDAIGIYFTKDLTMLNYIPLDTYDAAKVEFTKKGDLIVIDNKLSFKLFIANPLTGIIKSYGDKDYCLGFSCHKISNTENFLALGAYDDCIHILNTDTWKPICQIQIKETIDLSRNPLHREENQQFNVIREGRYKLPSKKQVKEKDNQQPPGISILEFSPQDDYLAAKIQTMSNCIFIYNVHLLQLVTVIQTSRPVKDFKWLQIQNQVNTLCIATGNKNLFLWKSLNYQGQIFQVVIPTSNSINITNIELAKNGKMLLYASGQKKYSYALYDTYSYEK